MPELRKDTPGMEWRNRENGKREIYWLCQKHIAKRGFRPKSIQLWKGTGEPTADEWETIGRECQRLHMQMKSFIWNPTRRKPLARKGSIYFIVSGDHVKIGYSDKVEKRFRSLQTASPTPLTLLAEVPDKTKQDERQLHRRFVRYHAQGEWFTLSAEILAYVEAEQKAN